MALLAAAFALAAAPASAQAKKQVLRIGWAQDVQTLNPFVGQDEENFRVWALTWDLPVAFSPNELSPAPGLAKSWTVSPDRRTVTFKLVDAQWSDGQPITSKDVKYSLEVLGGNGLIFTGYTDNITSIDTPDDKTVVVHTSKPDARIVGGLFVYVIPQHVYGKVPVKRLTGSYQPKLPMVGSGPYVVTDFQRGRILKLDRNPRFRGPKPKFDEIQFIKYGTSDAVDRALRLGEIDTEWEVEPTSFPKLEDANGITTVRSPSRAFTELAFNLCSKQHCPDAKSNPAIKDRSVRQAIGYAVDRGRLNAIASRGTAFVGHGILPSYYKAWYERPAEDYPYDPGKANRLLDAAGYARGEDGIRRKGDTKLSFDLFVRSESQSNIQAARLVAEQARKVGIDFDVQVVSVDKLTEMITRTTNGKPAPQYDTFIWGWGGDPYDPSGLLKLLTTNQIGETSDSFYSNPEYDRLFEEQIEEFDHARRKALIRRMIDISQRDLPYLVLTQDPILEAYRTDRLTAVERVCPKPNGDAFCRDTGYQPILTVAPGKDDDGSGAGAGLIAAITVVLLGGMAFLIMRRRRGRAEREPLEVER